MTIAKISSTLLRAIQCRPYDQYRSYDQFSPQPRSNIPSSASLLPADWNIAGIAPECYTRPQESIRSRSEHLSGGVASTPFNSARKRLAILARHGSKLAEAIPARCAGGHRPRPLRLAAGNFRGGVHRPSPFARLHQYGRDLELYPAR